MNLNLTKPHALLQRGARILLIAASCLLLKHPTSQAQPASGDTDEAAKEGELVKKTLNPVANLISVPIQNNWGYRYYAEGSSGGPDWGLRFAVTFLFPT